MNVDSNVRSLDINANGLLNNTSVDGTYNMRKTPVSVDIGDSVKYEIKIFNESKDLDGYAKEITDYLPDGLKFNISSDVNAKTIGDYIPAMVVKLNGMTKILKSLLRNYTNKY